MRKVDPNESGSLNHFTSVGSIFEDSCTKEVTGVGKAVFEGEFKFTAYEARKNLTAQLQQSIERKTSLHLHPLKSIKNWRLN